MLAMGLETLVTGDGEKYRVNGSDIWLLVMHSAQFNA